MDRIIGQGILHDDEHVAAYATADFSESNQRFCNLLFQKFGSSLSHILDIGCGPADVAIRLLRHNPTLKVTAVDASEMMLKFAQEAIERSGFERQILPILGRVPGLDFADYSFDAIISKDVLHHIPDPMAFWGELLRLVKKETVIFIMDLYRPRTIAEAKNIVNAVVGNGPDILKQDFYHSLISAFTIDEVKTQLAKIRLPLQVDIVSDRHFVVRGMVRDDFDF